MRGTIRLYLATLKKLYEKWVYIFVVLPVNRHREFFNKKFYLILGENKRKMSGYISQNKMI